MTLEEIGERYGISQQRVNKITRLHYNRTGEKKVSKFALTKEQKAAISEDIRRTKFWSRVNIKANDACWLWIGFTMAGTYGVFGYHGKKPYAHRLAWLFYYGSIDEDLRVLHKCNNPSCCNPHHLYQGTDKQNMDDRDVCGHTTGRKLQDNDYLEIWKQYHHKNISVKEISHLYRIHPMSVYQIIRGNRAVFADHLLKE